MAEIDEEVKIEPVQKLKKDKRKVIGGLLLGAIPLLFIVYLVLGPVFHILSKDLKSKEMYVISEFVNVRATSDANSLKMGKALYGTKLLVYEIKDDFAEVLIDGQKGYVSSEFIADPARYYAIEGLFGDDKKENTSTATKYKLGLLRYLEWKGYTSNIPEDIQIKIFGEKSKKQAYQIYSEPRGSKYNSSVYADFDGDFNTDVAYVLKNAVSDKKILVILSFDRKDPLNISKPIFEYEIEKPWNFIRIVKKGTKLTMLNDKQKLVKDKIPVNGLIMGSNRSKELNDPEYLIIYNGEKFEVIEQPEDKKN